jgi:hypothetical protein
MMSTLAVTTGFASHLRHRRTDLLECSSTAMANPFSRGELILHPVNLCATFPRQRVH